MDHCTLLSYHYLVPDLHPRSDTASSILHPDAHLPAAVHVHVLLHHLWLTDQCPSLPSLTGRAPNKKRGMLWTYMQLHDPKSEDNTTALLATVNRLHETRELPPHLLAQLDAQLLESRAWKAIHKAEKEFLENVGGELHYLALPHPVLGALAAPMQNFRSSSAGASPVAATMPHHSYSHAVLPGAAYLPPAGLKREATMDSSQTIMTDVPGIVTGAVNPHGLDHYLLTAQDPLLGCVPETVNPDSYRAYGDSSYQHQQPINSCPAAPASDSSAEVGPAGLGYLPAQALAPASETAHAGGMVVQQTQAQHLQVSGSYNLQMAYPQEQPCLPAVDCGHDYSSRPQMIAATAAVEPSPLKERDVGPQFSSIPKQHMAAAEPDGHQQCSGFVGRQLQNEECPASENMVTGLSRATGGHGPHCRYATVLGSWLC